MNWVEVLEAIAATSDSRRHVDQLRRTAITAGEREHKVGTVAVPVGNKLENYGIQGPNERIGQQLFRPGWYAE